MKIGVSAIAVGGVMSALVGCAVPPPKPDLPLDKIAPTPICEGDQQCSRMWGSAIEGISIVSRMKVMTVTDNFIQTYPTRDVGFLNGQVYKEKIGDGKYAIRGRFNCDPYTWCHGFQNQTQHTFNLYVQGYEPVKKIEEEKVLDPK